MYPERHGQAVSNSFNYFNPNSSDGLGSTFATSFTYWTDVVDPSTPSADATFSLLTPEGKNAPAPWVPFTRAGCNVGTVYVMMSSAVWAISGVWWFVRSVPLFFRKLSR